MDKLLDDYTKAEFPLDLPWKYGRARLLAAFGDHVVGVILFVQTNDDGSERLSLAQVLNWDGQGKFAGGEYPEMNLPPPPAKTADRVAELRDEMANCQGRLDGMPDAPAEWRGIDERRIRSILAEIEKITGVPA